MILLPKIMILDSATLNRISRDYWSDDSNRRDKSRDFVAKLRECGVFIAFSLHHICEMLRYNDENVIRHRLKWLQQLPLIAWLRPYNGDWFPGMISDLVERELHVVVNDSKKRWQEIISKVREGVWETGVGNEMFLEDVFLNSEFIKTLKFHNRKEITVSSLVRSDPGRNRDVKIKEIRRQNTRTESEIKAYYSTFVSDMKEQLDLHGDKRLQESEKVARSIANHTTQSIGYIGTSDGDIVSELLKMSGIPKEFVNDEMTVGELAELAVYVKRLKLISSNLNPPIEVSINDVPPDTLPSYYLERQVAMIQQKAKRVSGSDIGDRHILPLIFYADAIEVDKRTYEYLNQIKRKEVGLASIMGHFFKSTNDYSQIIDDAHLL